MTRLENAFLKNLFYRTRFQKKLISHSINNSNTILFNTNSSKKTNRDFIIRKRTRFLFGFHLNVNGFKPYLPKIKYPPYLLMDPKNFDFWGPTNTFFLIIQYKFSCSGALKTFPFKFVFLPKTQARLLFGEMVRVEASAFWILQNADAFVVYTLLGWWGFNNLNPHHLPKRQMLVQPLPPQQGINHGCSLHRTVPKNNDVPLLCFSANRNGLDLRWKRLKI